MAPPYVRVNVWTLAATDPIITFYEQAVTAMQARPATDPTSWSYQAAMHDLGGTTVRPLWRTCQHQNWYFLPWHRAYLYYFERIVRATIVDLGGPSDWALPYWNYDAGAGQNTLPIAFRAPPSPLFVPGRTMTGGAGLPAAATSPAAALKSRVFTGTAEFGGGKTTALPRYPSKNGLVESTPHNAVHGMIGGIMGNPLTAAEDPVFWLHHCNIDRLWWLWHQTNPNTTDSDWLTEPFEFFDETGTLQSKTSADVEDTLSQLDYTYDALPPSAGPVSTVKQLPTVPSVAWPSPWPRRPRPGLDAGANIEPTREMIGGSSEPVELVGEPVRVAIRVDARAMKELERIVPETSREQRAFLEIEGVDAPKDPGTVYGVYVNLPDGPTADDLAEFHVGNVSLFGLERSRDPFTDSQPHSMQFSMEITDVLNTLAARNEWRNGDELDVTFRPLALELQELESLAEPRKPLKHTDAPISIGRISVHYQ